MQLWRFSYLACMLVLSVSMRGLPYSLVPGDVVRLRWPRWASGDDPSFVR